MKKTISVLAFSLFSLQLIFAQQDRTISNKTKLTIYTEAYKAIVQYQECINNIGACVAENHDLAKAYANTFTNLFINKKVSIYNDLDPKKSLSEIYEVDTYINNMLLWYKNGIRVDLDFENAKVQNIVHHTDNIFTIDIILSKKIDGTYINNTVVDNTENLNFGIAFSMENYTKPSNFKFARIKEANSKASIKVENLYDLAGEQLPQEELQKIHNALRIPLNDYCNFLTLMASNEEFDSDKEFYKERVLSIFKNPEVPVADDLSDNASAGQISIDNYLKKYVSSFKQSNAIVAFDIDSTSFRNVIKDNKNTYTTHVSVNKKLYNNSEVLQWKTIIKFEFVKREGNYTDFKITDISNSASLQKKNNDILEKIEVLGKISRKGFSITGKIGTGVHSYISQDLSNIPLNESTYSWNKKNNYGNILAEMSLAFYPYGKVGFSTGFGYSNIATSYNLDGKYKKEEEELNDYNYLQYPLISAKYDSTIAFSTMYIPLHCHIHSSNAGNFGFYGTAGTSIEFIRSASYSRSGNFTLSAMLADTSNGIRYLLPQYSGGFEISGDKTETIHSFSKPSINIELSAGTEYYINNFTSITLGFYFSYGLNDLEKDKLTVKNIFNDRIIHRPSHFKKQGVIIGVQYKL